MRYGNEAVCNRDIACRNRAPASGEKTGKGYNDEADKLMSEDRTSQQDIKQKGGRAV